ncbi:cupin domain-containing protein [Streptomyces sp. NPDC059070]|uniref:cupin domain-containing protein n=1 Tax=Streptomyces sp. NPDC059070 TaxID=3346713 RepID=UPI0036D18709
MTQLVLSRSRLLGLGGVEVLLPSTATGGSAILNETEVMAATSGPPTDQYTHSDVTYLVLSGALAMYVDGRVTTLKAGSLAHISRGAEHAWATPLAQSARFLTLYLLGSEEPLSGGLHTPFEYTKCPFRSREALHELTVGGDGRLAGPEQRRLTCDGRMVPSSQADSENARALALFDLSD